MKKFLQTLDNFFNALSMAILWTGGIALALFIVYKLVFFSIQYDREYTKEIVKEAIQESK